MRYTRVSDLHYYVEQLLLEWMMDKNFFLMWNLHLTNFNKSI